MNGNRQVTLRVAQISLGLLEFPEYQTDFRYIGWQRMKFSSVAVTFVVEISVCRKTSAFHP